jgi:hypothetical protein
LDLDTEAAQRKTIGNGKKHEKIRRGGIGKSETRSGIAKIVPKIIEEEAD